MSDILLTVQNNLACPPLLKWPGSRLTSALNWSLNKWFQQRSDQNWILFISTRVLFLGTWYVGWFNALLGSFPLFGLSVPISDIYWPRERKEKVHFSRFIVHIVLLSQPLSRVVLISLSLPLSLSLSHAIVSLILFLGNPFTVAA